MPSTHCEFNQVCQILLWHFFQTFRLNLIFLNYVISSENILGGSIYINLLTTYLVSIIVFGIIMTLRYNDEQCLRLER